MFARISRVFVAVALVASVLVVFAPVAAAATLLVDDELDCDDTDGIPYFCTIRAAVVAASDGDVIEIAAGTYDSGLGSIIVDTFDAVNDLTFRGQGEGVTIIDGGSTKSGFRLYGTATYVIEDLSIVDTSSGGSGAGIVVHADADVTITDVTIDNADAAASGGGLYAVATSNVTLNNVTIINSSSAIGAGGGIFSQSSGSLQIFDSNISNNDAATSGGGIHTSGSGAHDVDIVRTRIADNTAVDNGGGIYFSVGAGNLNILDSEFDGNEVTAAAVGGGGGGLSFGSGIATIDRSLFYDNTSNEDGGGILDTTNSALTVTNSTFYANTATNGDGGGLKTRGVINNATIVGNTAGTDGGGLDRTLGVSTMRNSIVAGNTAPGDGPDCHGVLSDGYNVVSDSSDCFSSIDVTNTLNLDPGLGTFDDHGGETRTLSIDLDGTSDGAGNPAAPGSGGSACEAVDQRGATRHTVCDAGAFEVANAIEPTVGLVDVSQGIWHLRDESGTVTSFYYGNSQDRPVAGDWDGDGIDTPGLFRQSDGFFYARNTNDQGPADDECFAGNPSDVPLAGDWDGDGDDTLGIYRPSNQMFYLFNITCTGSPMGAAQIEFLFGNSGDTPVTGDWDDDGVTEIGLYRESTGYFYWRDTNDTGIATGEIYFGNPGDRFIAGDWGVVDGVDTPAIFRPSTGTFYFRHTLTQGPGDSSIVWGSPTWVPIAGVFGLG